MEKVKKFIDEVKKEFKKVSWPSKEEIYGSTAMVIFLSLVLAVYLFIVDKILEKLILLIL